MQSLDAITAPFFPSLAELGRFEPIRACDMPRASQELLDHLEHMTVSVEAFHGTAVNVRVLNAVTSGEVYTRSSLLELQGSGRPVQFGIMRIDMQHLSPIVRAEIEAQATPMGRILIRHGILRQVELLQLWRIQPGPVLQTSLNVANGRQIYGRSARIVVEGRPAVELLEIPID